MLIMEMEINLVNNIQKCNDFNKATKLLDEFKESVKKQRKALAKKYHPDLNKSADPDHMGKVNNACDLLMQLKVQKPQPIQVVRFYTHGATYSTTTTTSTSGGWGNYYY